MKNSIMKYLKLYDRQKWLCKYCKDKLISQVAVHLDHIIPKIKWWTLEYWNICLCCHYCNIVKKDNDVTYITEWIKPYTDWIVVDKKDLREYNQMIKSQKKFNI